MIKETELPPRAAFFSGLQLAQTNKNVEGMVADEILWNAHGNVAAVSEILSEAADRKISSATIPSAFC